MSTDEQGAGVDPVDPLELPGEAYRAYMMGQLTRMLEANEREAGAKAALRYRLIDTLRRQWEQIHHLALASDRASIPARALRAEVAALLGVAERTAENHLAHAQILVDVLPTTLDQLGDGLLTERHARIVIENITGLEPEQVVELERRALRDAPTLTASKFDRKVRTLRELISPSEMTKRHREAMAERDVWVTPDRDGMATLSIRSSAPFAYAAYDYADQIAKSLAVDGEERTRAQLRVDAITDLLLDTGAQLPPAEGSVELRPVARPRGIVPTVHVTAPVLSLAGVNETPATLDGYGPIDPETARQLVGAASGFHRVLTHPETGATLSFGRDRYEIPAELRRYLQHRDGTCRFIGCNRAAKHCDVDHARDWQWLGETNHDNLAHLCKGHHTLKHASSWKVAHLAEAPPGTLGWTSPLGRHYVTHPANAPLGRPPSSGSPPSGAVAQTDWLDDDSAPF